MANQSKTHKVSLFWDRAVGDDGPKGRQRLKLLLVAARHHLSGQDLRSVVNYLERDDVGFEVTLQLPIPLSSELLELRLVITPAIKLCRHRNRCLPAATSFSNSKAGSPAGSRTAWWWPWPESSPDRTG